MYVCMIIKILTQKKKISPIWLIIIFIFPIFGASLYLLYNKDDK